jgi:transposase
LSFVDSIASASGTTVPAIARLVAADEDTVRDVIHAFNTEGLSCLGPHWAGGAPRRITDADTTLIVVAVPPRHCVRADQQPQSA